MGSPILESYTWALGGEEDQREEEEQQEKEGEEKKKEEERQEFGAPENPFFLTPEQARPQSEMAASNQGAEVASGPCVRPWPGSPWPALCEGLGGLTRPPCDTRGKETSHVCTWWAPAVLCSPISSSGGKG